MAPDPSDPDVPDADGDEEGDDGTIIDSDPSAFFNSPGGPTTITAVTQSDGSITLTVYGGDAGVLALDARTTTLPSGLTGTASASAYLRMTLVKDLWAWGDGGQGALGIGTTKASPIPVSVALPASVTTVKSLWVGENRRAFALDGANRVWAWGSSSQNNLTVQGHQKLPVDITSKFPSRVVQIAGGQYSTYALLDDGRLYGWGFSGNNALFSSYNAVKPVANQATPYLLDFSTTRGVDGLLTAPIKKIATSRRFAYLLLEDGTVWSYGRNYNGALGWYTNKNGVPSVADYVSNDLGRVKGFPAGRTVIDITGRLNGANVVLDDGSVWGWGLNNYSQIGDGTTKTVAAPVAATAVNAFGKRATRVFGEWYHTGVLFDDGTATVFGMAANYANGNANAGVGGRQPQLLSFPSPATQLSLGYQSGHALLRNGTVWGWGRNSSGQVGDGKKAAVQRPVQVVGLPGQATAIAETMYTVYALVAG